MTDRRARGPDQWTRALLMSRVALGRGRTVSAASHTARRTEECDGSARVSRAMNTGAMNPVHARHGPP